METIYLIIPGKISNSFADIIKIATENYQLVIIKTVEDLPDLKNKKIIFAIELDKCGFNIPLFEMFLKLRKRGNLIESVLIFSDKRVTECISSQIGCKYNCVFCERY
ncbi:unnamed protein product [marine sediment metagenome]|uniref:Uncharacterized protein n=1 Tax=marine sediment metagenome TaxID=412755 RepID=X1MC53_9ZZZZ